MSSCMECGCDMHPADAAQWEYCHACRKLLKYSGKVRTLNRQGADQLGRSARDTKMLGGEADDTTGANQE